MWTPCSFKLKALDQRGCLSMISQCHLTQEQSCLLYMHCIALSILVRSQSSHDRKSQVWFSFPAELSKFPRKSTTRVYCSPNLYINALPMLFPADPEEHWRKVPMLAQRQNCCHYAVLVSYVWPQAKILSLWPLSWSHSRQRSEKRRCLSMIRH